MAEEKRARTMRSDPPASPTEVLRTVPKGCTESIRVRKGAPDDIRLELPVPGALNPSTESALEFPGEILGSAEYKSPAKAGELVSLEGEPAAEPMSVLSETPSPMRMMGVDISGDGQVFTSFESVSDMPVEHGSPNNKVRRFETTDPIFAPGKVRRSDINALFDELEEMLSVIDRYQFVPSEELYRIERDPKKRHPDQRFGTVPSLSKIRLVMLARLKRFYGLSISPLTRETIKNEIKQMLSELQALGWIE